MPAVLVVDDNPAVRFAIQTALEPAVEVYLAEDGAQAIEMLVTNQFDLVLLDALMPVLDGRETLKVINARQIKVPTFVLATGSKLSSYADLQALGVETLIAKPVSLEALRALVYARVNVPLVVPIEADPVVVVGPPPPAPVPKEFRLLLVDEHEQAAKRFVELTPAYVELEHTADMVAAMTLIHKRPYRAVVVDVTALKKLREDEFTTLRMISHQAVLIGLYLRTTADADAQALSQGLDLGLHKPFDLARFEALMASLRGPYLTLTLALNILGLRANSCLAKNPESHAKRLVTEIGMAFDEAAEACEATLWLHLDEPAPKPILELFIQTAIERARLHSLDLGWVDPHGYGEAFHPRLREAGVTILRSFDEIGLG